MNKSPKDVPEQGSLPRRVRRTCPRCGTRLKRVGEERLCPSDIIECGICGHQWHFNFAAFQRERKGARDQQATPGLGGADGLETVRIAERVSPPNARTERRGE